MPTVEELAAGDAERLGVGRHPRHGRLPPWPRSTARRRSRATAARLAGGRRALPAVEHGDGPAVALASRALGRRWPRPCRVGGSRGGHSTPEPDDDGPWTSGCVLGGCRSIEVGDEGPPGRPQLPGEAVEYHRSQVEEEFRHGNTKLKPGPAEERADDHEHGPEHQEHRHQRDGELAVLGLVARVAVGVGRQDQAEGPCPGSSRRPPSGGTS